MNECVCEWGLAERRYKNTFPQSSAQQLDTAGCRIEPRPSLPAVDQTVHVVDLFIGPVSPVVFPQVFDGGHGQDEDHGSQSELGLERVDNRNKVEQSDEDEVNIGEPVELFEEVLWKE